MFALAEPGCQQQNFHAHIHMLWTSCRSLSGDGPIHTGWCEPQPANATDPGRNATVVYVGQKPEFDYCMEQICLAANPSSYRVRYLDTFSITAVANTMSRAQYYILLDSFLTANGSTAEMIDKSLQNKAASDAWQLGSGAYYDPCLDRSARTNVYIAYGVFGASVLLILLIGMFKWFRAGKGELQDLM